MKKFIVTMCLIISVISFSSVSFAGDKCREFSKLAALIMENRQHGVPLTSVIEKIEGINDKPEVKSLLINLTIQIYKTPRYNVEANQQEAITEMGNEAYLMCIE
jgi:hypothetical protein